MLEPRDRMIEKLNALIVPRLLRAGLKGAFPHFRRRTLTCIDLLTFQFAREGGAFSVELAQCAPTGIVTEWGDALSPDEVTALDVDPSKRTRVRGVIDSTVTDAFRFDGSKGDPYERAALALRESLDDLDMLFARMAKKKPAKAKK
jgi:hypothetical protein